MKLLDQIVDLLTDGDGSLNEALLKTKVLLSTIGQVSLIGWVNDELTGYGKEADAPEYRSVHGRVLGNISNGYYTVRERQPVSLDGTPDGFREHWENWKLTEALGVLEKAVAADNGKNYLSRELPPELLSPLSSMLNTGYHYEKVWSQVELSQVRQILITVRSRLLDFILSLRGEIGDSMSDKEAKAAAAAIDVKSMFAGAVIGDNATFQILGHQNQQRVSNTNLKGDTAALIAELRKHHVEEGDIAALEDAIRTDPPKPETSGHFGPKVKGWIKGMMDKAVDASWNIELGVAGGLLTSALQKYYGLP